jgi:sterol desaturase/sphingolipid hydroxylase (fatty acid hydroxylase superfamily)
MESMTNLLGNFSLADAAKLIGFVFPVLFFVEMVFLAYTYRKSPSALSRALKLPILAYALNTALAVVLSLNVFVLTQPFFSRLAPFHVSISVAGFIYAYVVWELGHFIFHWSCHKVRLLWCIHAPHHCPEHMNLSVVHANFILLAVYAAFIRTAVCSLLGVPIPLLIFSIVIDSCWGGIIHVSEEAWRGGRLPGVLGRMFLSPIHHRVHHACSPEYIDKNFCNTLPIWDKVFGTFQDEIEGAPLRYGVTRPLKPGSFMDFYFGEFVHLAKDVMGARSVKNAILYLVMPPGWQPVEFKAEHLERAKTA